MSDFGKAIDLSARLIDARDAMKRLHGTDWPGFVNLYGDVIRACSRKTGKTILEATHQLAAKANEDGQNMVAVMFLAVGAELASSAQDKKSA